MAKLVADTYGDALFELALSESSVDSLYEEALAVLGAFRDNKELGKLLNHPKIETNEKQKVIENCFKPFVSDNMTGFLVLMVAKARYNAIEASLSYFVDKVKLYKGIGTVYVKTAAPLREEQKTRLIERLLKTTDYKQLEMNYAVDDSLIGGMIIRIGDRVVDSSIKTKLEDMTRDLKKLQLG